MTLSSAAARRTPPRLSGMTSTPTTSRAAQGQAGNARRAVWASRQSPTRARLKVLTNASAIPAGSRVTAHNGVHLPIAAQRDAVISLAAERAKQA